MPVLFDAGHQKGFRDGSSCIGNEAVVTTLEEKERRSQPMGPLSAFFSATSPASERGNGVKRLRVPGIC